MMQLKKHWRSGTSYMVRLFIHKKAQLLGADDIVIITDGKLKDLSNRYGYDVTLNLILLNEIFSHKPELRKESVQDLRAFVDRWLEKPMSREKVKSLLGDKYIEPEQLKEFYDLWDKL